MHMRFDTRHSDSQSTSSGLGSLVWWVAAALIVLLAGEAKAVQVQDLVRLKGSESSKLIGMGIVVGLNGTGDGSKFASSHKMLAEAVGKLADETATVAQISESDAVALVYLSAEIPGHGVRSGDKLDVQIAKAGDAKSLEGGRLVISWLAGPTPDAPVMAVAEGQVSIPDPRHPTTAKIEGGAQMIRDVVSQPMDQFGRVHLVLNDSVASWPAATSLARLINEVLAPDAPPIAQAVDQKNILVSVPQDQRATPGSFISQILRTYVEPALIHSGAKVLVNARTGTIVITGDVMVSPVVISHEGLTITSIRPPQPAAAQAQQAELVEERFIPIDPAEEGGASLSQLLEAFNQLKVPATDRIAIIRQIAASGKLHAQLIEEE